MNDLPDPNAFDPYHTWLGIPPDQQPANFYRLLGLELFESDADVIDVAANRQVAYLRQVGHGDKQPIAKQLAKQIADARRVLIDDQSRRVYDRQLNDARPAPGTANPSVSILTDSTLTDRSDAARPRRPSSPRSGKSKKRNRRPMILMCSAAALVAVTFIGGGLIASRSNQEAATADASLRPTPQRPPVSGASDGLSISDAFDRKLKAVEAGGRAVDTKVAGKPGPVPPLKSNNRSNRSTGTSRSVSTPTAALTSAPRSAAATKHRADVQSLPIFESFETGDWKDRFETADRLRLTKHHEIRDGALLVLKTDSSYRGTPMRLKGVDLQPGRSFSMEARMPKGLSVGSGFVIHVDGFRMAVRIAGSKEIKVTAQTAAKGATERPSTELESMEYENDQPGLQNPYVVLLTRLASAKARYAWSIESPSGRVYEGLYDATNASGSGAVTIQASRSDARIVYFWIDNLRYGTIPESAPLLP